MLKPYDMRVSATYEALKASMEILGKESKQLETIIRKTDDSVAGQEFRKKDFHCDFKHCLTVQ